MSVILIKKRKATNKRSYVSSRDRLEELISILQEGCRLSTVEVCERMNISRQTLAWLIKIAPEYGVNIRKVWEIEEVVDDGKDKKRGSSKK